jgi:predicted nucleic acid-binding protein
MSYLVDTNVLLRSVQKFHPMQSDADRAITQLLLRQPEAVYIIPQNLIEFWAVATRPRLQNGLGLSVDETASQIAYFKFVFMLLPDSNEIFLERERLVGQHQVVGKQVYDARLVAAMSVHHLTHLLTFNAGDFKRFTDITAVSPTTILSDERSE